MLNFLANLQDHCRGEGVFYLDIRTEHKRDGKLFRGHPNYRGTGQWNDWAVFDWNEEGELPCHIMGFVDLRDLPDGFSFNYGGIDGISKGIYTAE